MKKERIHLLALASMVAAFSIESISGSRLVINVQKKHQSLLESDCPNTLYNVYIILDILQRKQADCQETAIIGLDPEYFTY